ncbi:hypothetical protein WBG78_23225 [Chryseolinea sp. T2]|uniref:hypothetical protein n=1 Tax=Chryseolinea sp. T2 TaxID=3129255 RepID=UPI003076F23D
MRMGRLVKILLSIGIMVVGWLMIGIGYTTKLRGSSSNEIMFVGGIGLFFGGLTAAIKWGRKRDKG